MRPKSAIVTFCLGAIIIYSGCKKSASTPAPVYPTLSASQTALAAATGIESALLNGVPNLSTGLNAAAPFTDATPTCGFIVDTTETSTTVFGVGSTTLSGTIKLAFSCTNNVVSGFTTSDNYTLTGNLDSIDTKYSLVQNFTLASLNPSIWNSNFSISGTYTSSGTYQIMTANNKGSGNVASDYTLTSVVFSPTAGYFVSGSATFNISETGPRGVFNCQGTLTFLANQIASVVISGKTYSVNLVTGAVS
jgi:hypothetical protein